jgi:signal transduction histidine kinase
MRFARLNLLRRSIRFRLMTWNTGVLLVVSLFALFAVREGVRITLLAELDERLREDALEVSLAVKEFYPRLKLLQEEVDRKAIGHAHQDMFIQLVDGKTRAILSSVNSPQVDVRMQSGEPPTNWRGYRIVQQPIGDSPAGFAVRVGVSTASIQDDLSKLTRLTVLVGLALLPVAAIGGFLLTDRALTPINKIIDTARRLRPAQLDERLTLRGTGDELDRLSLTINRLLDRIGEYLMRHREFVANAAHELRSPLAAIQSSVEVGLNSERSVEEYKELLCETVEQCRSLGLLVNQLLLLAESDVARTLETNEVVRLDHVVERSVEMFRAAAEEREIELRHEIYDCPEVRGSALRLRQVVNNLIDNALKFTPAGGQVVVTLQEDAERGDAVIKLTDTGPGIPSEELPRIFERFYQVDRSRERERGSRGSGLGLSICQAIVLTHGGEISAESTVGRGTTFTVRLPVQVPARAPA